MAEVYQPGGFYTGGFVQQPASALEASARRVVIVEIEARPQVSQLVMNHAPSSSPQPDSMGQTYHFYYVNTGGSLVVSGTQPQFANKTDHYVNTADIPSILVFLDENGDSRYVYSSSTPALVSSATPFPFSYWPKFVYEQYVGEYLEMIGENGTDIYRITVNSSDVISVTLNRSEPDRIKPIRISQGHSFPFDGTNLWIEGLISIGDMSTSMPQQETGFGGVAFPNYGVITIQNADKRWNFLLYQSWDSRTVNIRVGSIVDTIPNYPIYRRGSTISIEGDLDTIRITLRDASTLFSKSMQENRYGGTGGYDGSEELEGRIKPLALGFINDALPVLVDSSIDLYQIHDGPVQSIFNVFEGGIARAALGDITAYGLNDLTEWAPTQQQVDDGAYMSDLVSGLFRLANPPVGIITASTIGSTGIPDPYSISQIISSIMSNYLPSIILDQDSFDEFQFDRPYGAGIYIDSESTVLDALNALLAPIRCAMVINHLNRAKITRIRTTLPVGVVTDASLNGNIVDNSYYSIRQAKKPGAVYDLNWRKTWANLTETDILDGAVSSVKEQLLRGYRHKIMAVNDSSTTRLPIYESAQNIELRSLYTGVSAAQEVVYVAMQDQIRLNLIQVSIGNAPFPVKLLDTVLLKTANMNLQNQHSAIVVGITEYDPTSNRDGQIDLLLWV